MMMLSALILAACGAIPSTVDSVAPAPAEAVTTASAATGQDVVCQGVWFRFSKPNELPAESDPWTVYLIADDHDPATLAYSVKVMWVNGTPSQHPTVTVTPGPQTIAPTVRTVADCFGCEQMIARVKATTPQDCSEVTILYPFDHSNGQ